MSRSARGSAVAAAVALLLGAGVGVGQDSVRLTPSIEFSQGVDSNVGNRDHDVDSDAVTVLAPAIEISHEGELGRARLRVGLKSRSYWDHSELNAIDRYAIGEIDRMLTPRLGVFADGSFRYFPERDPFDDGTGPDLAGDRPDWRRYGLAGGFRYALDPVSTLSLSSGFDAADYGEGEVGDAFRERDWRTYSAALGYQRALSERDEVGLTFGFERAWIDSADLSAGEETSRVLSAVASWRRAWSAAWSTSFAGGVRWASIHSDPIPGFNIPISPGIDLDPTDRSLGFRGSASLERKTLLSTLVLSYGRELRPASGYGGQVDVDTIVGSYTRRLTERLTVATEGFLQRYESAGEALIPIKVCDELLIICVDAVGLTDNAIDARVYGATLRADWRLREHWTTFLRYDYRDQKSEGDRDVSAYDDHRLTAGFRYALPIDLR